MFDYNQLIKHHIPLSILPENSIIINETSFLFTIDTKRLFGLLSYSFCFNLLLFFLLIAAISRRKKAERVLRKSEEQLRHAVINSPFPIMIHAEDGAILMISDAWTEITGYSHADIPTTNAWDGAGLWSAEASCPGEH